MDKSLPFAVRKSPRLPDYDYSRNNFYFITICTHQKQCIFGSIEELSWMGKIVQEELNGLENHYPNVKVDVSVVMPNHIHAIIVIDTRANNVKLSTIVGLFKSGVSRRINQIQPNLTVWQRSFHDHIIRNQASYEKIWNYVKYNAQKWEADIFHPDHQ